MNAFKKTIIEVNLSEEEYQAFDEARKVAWKIGRSEEFDSFPKEIQTLIDNIANSIDELMMYVSGECN